MSQLRQALELAESGEREIDAPSVDASGYPEFQALGEALLEAKSLGLLYEAKEQRSNARAIYGHIVRVVFPGGLTPKGKSALVGLREGTKATNDQGTPTSKAPDIFQLRPGIWGISIDLKALWKSWRKSGRT